MASKPPDELPHVETGETPRAGDPLLDTSPGMTAVHVDTQTAAKGAERLFEEAQSTRGLNRLLVHWGITGKSQLEVRALPENLTVVRMLVPASEADRFYRAAQELDVGVPITRLVHERNGLTPIDLIAPPGKIAQLLELAGEGSHAFAVNQSDDGEHRNSIPVMVLNGCQLVPLTPTFPPNRDISKHSFGYVMRNGAVVRDQEVPPATLGTMSAEVKIARADDMLSADAVAWQREVENQIAPESAGRRPVLTIDTSRLYGDGTRVNPGVRILAQQMKSLARLGSNHFYITGNIDTVEIACLDEKVAALLVKVGLTLKAGGISCWLSEPKLTTENDLTKAAGLPADAAMDALRKSETARFPTSKKIADTMGSDVTADRAGSFGTVLFGESAMGRNIREITGIDERVRIATDGPPEFFDPSGVLVELKTLLEDDVTQLIVLYAVGGTGKSRVTTELTKTEPDTAMSLSFEGEVGDPGSGLARIARSISAHLTSQKHTDTAATELQKLADDPTCAARFISADMHRRQMDIAILGDALLLAKNTVNDDVQNLHRTDLENLLTALDSRISEGKPTIILLRPNEDGGLPALITTLIAKMNRARPGSAHAIEYPGLDFAKFELSHQTATKYIASYLKKLHAADPDRYEKDNDLMRSGSNLGTLPMHLARIAGNNPQIMNDLVRSLFEGNALERGADNVVRMKEGVDIAQVISSADSPAEYPRIFATALKALPTDERQLLYTAALTGKQLTPIQLRKIADKILVGGKSHQGTIDKILNRFFTGIKNRESGLVDSYGWTHDLQREATLGAIPDSEAAQLAGVAFKEADVHTVGLSQWIAKFVKPDANSAFWITYGQTLRDNLSDARKRNSVPEALFCARSTMEQPVVQNALAQMNAVATHKEVEQKVRNMIGTINVPAELYTATEDLCTRVREIAALFNTEERTVEFAALAAPLANEYLLDVGSLVNKLIKAKTEADEIIATYPAASAGGLAPLAELSNQLSCAQEILDATVIIAQELSQLGKNPKRGLNKLIKTNNDIRKKTGSLTTLDISTPLQATVTALAELAPKEIPPDHLQATVRESLFTLAELSSSDGNVTEGLFSIDTLRKHNPLPEGFDAATTPLSQEQLRICLAEVFTHYTGLMNGQGSIRTFDTTNNLLLSGATQVELEGRYPLEGAVVRERALFRKMDLAQRAALDITRRDTALSERESTWSQLRQMAHDPSLNGKISAALASVRNQSQAGNALELMRMGRIRAPFQYRRFETQNVQAQDALGQPITLIQDDEELFRPQRTTDSPGLRDEVENILEAITEFEEQDRQHPGALITFMRLSVDEMKALTLMWAGQPDEALSTCTEASRIALLNGLHLQAFRFGMIETLMGRVFSTIEKQEGDDETTWVDRAPKDYDAPRLRASLDTLIKRRLPAARALGNPALVEETQIDILKYISLICEQNLASHEGTNLKERQQKTWNIRNQIRFSKSVIPEAHEAIAELASHADDDVDINELDGVALENLSPEQHIRMGKFSESKTYEDAVKKQRYIIKTHTANIAEQERSQLPQVLSELMPIVGKFRHNNQEVIAYLEVGFEAIRNILATIPIADIGSSDPNFKNLYYIFEAFHQISELADFYGIPLPDDIISHPAFSDSATVTKIVLHHGKTLVNGSLTRKIMGHLHQLASYLSPVEVQGDNRFDERAIVTVNKLKKENQAYLEAITAASTPG